jgi:hypothetical protein
MYVIMVGWVVVGKEGRVINRVAAVVVRDLRVVCLLSVAGGVVTTLDAAALLCVQSSSSDPGRN